MIGVTIEAKRRWPISVFVFLLIAALFLVGALTERETAHFWVGTALFSAAALVRWFAEPPRFTATFDADFVTLDHEQQRVAYSEICALFPAREVPLDTAPDHYPMAIQLADREILVPARLSVPSREIETWLNARMPDNRQPPEGQLQEYVDRMVAQFGEDRVWWTRGLGVISQKLQRNRGLLVTAIFLSVVGLGSAITAGLMEKDSIAGVCALGWGIGFILLLVALLPKSKRSYAPKVINARDAIVVITPMGMAIVQGALRGEARWDEIKEVKLRAKPPRFAITSASMAAGLDIVMAGATVRLFDIYDRSLVEIHERVSAYWQ